LSDGNIHIPFYLSPEVQSRFGEENVNVKPKVVAYERSSRALSTGPSMLNPTAPAEWINIVSSDNDVALIGSELKQINGIFAPTGSDIEEPQDLEGATLGVPFINSGTAKMMGAMLQDTYGIDIREDVESESAPPSVLYEQMLNGDSLDAVMLWTGTTVEALANDSELKQVMSATEHWTERTGKPPMILNHGVRRDWLEENPGKALSYVSGWEKGVSWAFGESQVKSLYDQYGRIAGITSDAEFQTIMDLYDNERILLRDQSKWDEDLVDAQWDLYELMEETGFIDAAPSRDLGITHSELSDMAESA
jgi:ABC-type nitrate/sulfonate/bicarbonate transport system substrate-binding protein